MSNSAKTESFKLENFPLYKRLQTEGIEIIADKDHKLFGIRKGDIIEFSSSNKIYESHLTIWNLRNLKRYIIGFAYENFGEISIVSSKKTVASFKKDEIVLLGIIRGALKPCPTFEEFFNTEGIYD